MWLTNSSIGRKFVMALTGAFLILFVTFHVLMNGVALFWPAAYNTVCEFLGANWYALIGTAILAAGFALHILYACWLTWQNRRARGSNRYAVTSRPKQVEWTSKNMLVLGVVIICFLAVHMYQFWAKMQLVEVLHLPTDIPPSAGTLFFQQVFSCPWTLVIYLIGFAALWLHMTHGFWSMFQSSGCDNGVWFNRLKCIGNAWATIVCLLFAAEAIVFTVNAKKDNYLTNPKLIEQYQEMAAEGEGYPFIQSLADGNCCWSSDCGDCTGACGLECGCQCEECACGTCTCDPCECDPCNCATQHCEGCCAECPNAGTDACGATCAAQCQEVCQAAGQCACDPCGCNPCACGATGNNGVSAKVNELI